MDPSGATAARPLVGGINGTYSGRTTGTDPVSGDPDSGPQSSLFNSGNFRCDFTDSTEFEFSSGQGFTITLWYATSASGSPDALMLFSKGFVSNSGARYGAFIDNGNLSFLVNNGTTSYNATYNGGLDGNFHHYAGRYDPDAAAVTVWVDGVQRNSVGSVAEAAYGSNADQLRLGAAYLSRTFTFYAAYFAVFPRSLTDGEIKAQYNVRAAKAGTVLG